MQNESPRPADLLTASGKKTERLERRRRDSKFKRRDRERRTQGKRGIGIEISPIGLSFAMIEAGQNGQLNRLKTRWIEFPEETGPTAGDWDDDTLLESLQWVCGEFDLAGQGVLIALGGSPCVTRIINGNNELVDQDIKELTDRSRNYLALGQGEKVCSHSERRIDAKRKRAWVTVAQRSIVEKIAQAISATGLRLICMEHNLAIICRVLGDRNLDTEKPVLVITAEADRIDLGISYQGRLLLDYRPAILSKSDTLGEVVRRHIKCLRRYLFSVLQDPTLELSSAYIIGDQRLVETLEEDLQSENLELCQLDFSAITDAIQCSGESHNGPGMIAAVWLAQHCHKQDEEDTTNDLMHSLRTQNQVSWQQILRTTWPLCAAVILALGLYGWTIEQRMETTHKRNKMLALEPQNLEMGRLKVVVSQGEERSKYLRSLKKSIAPARWNHILSQVGSMLPNGTWLRSLTVDSDRNVIVAGSSFTEDSIFEYVSKLKGSQLFHRVALQSTQAMRIRSEPVFRFEITAALMKPTEQPDSLPKMAKSSDSSDDSAYAVQPSRRGRNG